MTVLPQNTKKRSFIEARWTAEDTANLYGLRDWGKGYFGLSPSGHVTCMPTQDPTRAIDLFEVVEGLRERGVHTPVLLRFDDLLEQRLRELRTAFDQAITDNEYSGKYTCVYPVKVNQQRHLCEQIRDLNLKFGFGLEAGSKPELLAVLALTAGHNHMPIVCNGFKDSEFIETVILATKLGRNILTVVEKYSELELIIEHSRRYNVRPQIGVRAKLSARGAGRWETSGGLRSKFGLTMTDIVQATERLREVEMLDCLKMIHCHLGSQVYDIRNFKHAVTELAYIYAELRRLGAGCDTIDIGGGLGVDYDGSQSAWDSSINYTISEYAADVVYRIKNVCDDAKVPHANIVSESGRFIAAHSSVLICNVLGRTRFDVKPDVKKIRAELEALEPEKQPQPVFDLVDAYERISDRNLVDVYHDAIQARDEAMSLFSLGYMSLPMRAHCEVLFWSIGREILERSMRIGELAEEFEGLPVLLSDIYFCNFSVFQSVPDSWAIDQLFPIAPIHRLDEQPTRVGVLADITCDSDGKIERFVDKREEKKILELHDLKEGEPYYLGLFLVGAYQEVLGDLHNLFGDTHVVHVRFEEDGTWSIDEIVAGDTVSEVLGYVQFDGDQLLRTLRRDVERAVKSGRLEAGDSKALMAFYEDGMQGYTYLE
ncbi:MAG: biosynthetic arginine decarboxylase [Planctomycetes bacterium]|nr:biosynthetic arginine decarboxylase [Planctomycetota bacterium]MCC7169450.1 biosynthetic arginine decarboxylase [Planctomycetota bacterium]